ncbi:MAG TPA: hypothetical protein VG253_07000 [Streptosporangiaceae bacterium]|jgi:hypothetical protein|nr:hypothetical protein [Streptosporangiaceae bacterium]
MQGNQANPGVQAAAATISGVMTDLDEVAKRLAAGPMDDRDTERTARIIDRLSEELAEAAGYVRGTGRP